MGLLSKFNPWAGRQADVLLVPGQQTKLPHLIEKHLNDMGIRCEVGRLVGRSRHRVIHFFDFESMLDSPIHRWAESVQWAVSLTSDDMEHPECASQLTDLTQLAVVADCTSTANVLGRIFGNVQPTVIYSGISTSDFAPAPIDQRLAIRRKLQVPLDSVCVGVFEGLREADQALLVDTLQHLQDALGTLCLLGIGPKLMIDRELRRAGIPVIRFTPHVLHDLQECFGALDLYFSLSQQGDLRGILRSWASGIPLVSTPNRIATDVLRDGLTAAVSEFATGVSLAAAAAELYVDEEFRHGCCERGHHAIESFIWPHIFEQYQAFYSRLLVGPERAQAA